MKTDQKTGWCYCWASWLKGKRRAYAAGSLDMFSGGASMVRKPISAIPTRYRVIRLSTFLILLKISEVVVLRQAAIAVHSQNGQFHRKGWSFSWVLLAGNLERNSSKCHSCRLLLDGVLILPIQFHAHYPLIKAIPVNVQGEPIFQSGGALTEIPARNLLPNPKT